MRLSLSVTLSVLLHFGLVIAWGNSAPGGLGIKDEVNKRVISVRILSLPPSSAEKIDILENSDSQPQALALSESATEPRADAHSVNSPFSILSSDRYYLRSELTEGPHVVSAIAIGAPPTKLETSWKIRMRIYVSEEGFPDRLIVENSTAPSYVQEEAIAAFESAKYAPGVREGRAVKSQLLIEVIEK